MFLIIAKFFLEVVAILVCVILLLLFVTKLVSRRLLWQKHEHFSHVIRNGELEESVKSMLDSNVFIYFNHVKDPQVVKAYLEKLSEAWTTLSAQPELEETPVKVGFGMNNCTVTTDFIEKLQEMNWLHGAGKQAENGLSPNS